MGIGPIENNRPRIPHDGERSRKGEPIAPGLVTSMVHDVVRKHCCTRQQRHCPKKGRMDCSRHACGR